MYFKMIRNITLVGTRQGFRTIGPSVFEIWVKTCFRNPRRVKNSKISIFSNFVMLGVYIGVFEHTETIPDVHFTLRFSILKIWVET